MPIISTLDLQLTSLTIFLTQELTMVGLTFGLFKKRIEEQYFERYWEHLHYRSQVRLFRSISFY